MSNIKKFESFIKEESSVETTNEHTLSDAEISRAKDSLKVSDLTVGEFKKLIGQIVRNEISKGGTFN